MTNAEAIETLRANYPDACFEQLREAVDKAIKALEEPKWIPCSEPPKESGTYIVTAYDGTDKRVTFVKYQKTLKRWDLTGARAYWRILAYKPLPEPWGGEELCAQESKEK